VRFTASFLILWWGWLEPLAALAVASDPPAPSSGAPAPRMASTETPVPGVATPGMVVPVALPPSLVSVRAGRSGAVSGSPAALVDGTLEGIRSLDGAPAQLLYDLGEERAIEQLTAFGAGELRLWVVDEASGAQAAVEHAPMTLDGGLGRFVLERPFTTRRVMVEWTPASDAPLEELWLWGSSVERGPARWDEREALRLAAGPLPGALRFAAAAPAETDPSVATRDRGRYRFEVVLPPSLDAFASAYLTYALAGRAHWTELRRSINGRWSPAAAPAREPLPNRTERPSRQVEPLPLAALVPGRNSIELGAGSDERPLRPSDVALVLVPRAGLREAPVPEGRMRQRMPLEPGSHAVELIVDVLRSGAGELLVGADGSAEPLLRVPLAGHAAGVLHVDLGALAQRPFDDLWFERQSPAAAPVGAARAVLGRAFVRVQPLTAASAGTPGLEISHPLQGECTRAGVEIRGFATRGALAAVKGSRGERAELGSDGSFRLVLRGADGGAGQGSKQGRARQGRRSVEVRAALRTGEVLTERVAVDSCERAQAEQSPDWGAPYSVHLRAETGGVLEFAGARLEVPPGALFADTRLSIRPLEQPALAPLEDDKTNVTPDSGGFRFGPHGLKFRKPVLLTLPYDAAALGPGAREREVFAFYFDEGKRRWERIARIDEARDQRLASVTDHFTDFVTATIPTPDAPGPRSFDPNAMKGIELGSPMAGIPLMEPPAISAFGAAQLSHPIELPPGRNGIQPSLGFTYSSESGNGWLGVGWDVPISAIEIDTRFGVPRYTENEPLTYLLDGEQIVPATEAFLRERPFLRSPRARVGSGEVVQYVRRVEGRFERIERVGAQAPHHWVVTNKQGTQLIYGETGGARLSDPNESEEPEGRARVFRWQLERIVDTFGNEARFSYRRDEGCLATLDEPEPARCAENFTSLYPLDITYTHHPESLAGYRVLFELGNQPRLDRVLSARPGFVEATRQRLAGVRVEYRTSEREPFALIRRYAIEYVLGDFDKSLVASISLQGLRDVPAEASVAQNELLGPPHFVQHRFEYHSTRQLDPDGNSEYAIFAEPALLPRPPDAYQPQPWGEGLGRATRLTRLDTESSGQSASLSLSLFGLFKVGGGAGRSSGSDTLRQTLFDLDGDGLPDLLNDAGESARNRLIPSAADPASFFSGVDLDAARSGTFARRALPGVDRGSLGQTSRRGSSVEGNLSVLGGLVGASAGFSRTTTEDRSITSDFDGDGFADLVRVDAGRVLVRLGDRRGGFAPTPIEWGTLDPDDITATQTELLEAAADAAHLVDPLVRWRAPFAGEIEISAPLLKRRPGGDGLSAAIHLRRAGVASAIWRRVLSPDDLSVCVPSGASECGPPLRLDAEPGDELYFELSGSPGAAAARIERDGVADEVSWLPQVTYVNGDNAGGDAVEPHGRPTHVFSFADDFRVAGLPARAWVASAPGRVNIAGNIEKQRTGDDVSARVVHRDSAGSLLATHAVDLPADDGGAFAPALSSLDVRAGEILSFELVTDSPIDPERVLWLPSIRYETYGRIDPATGSYVIGAVSCADDQCSTDNDPTPDLPVAADLIEQQALGAVSTFDFLPAQATQSFRLSTEQEVAATVDFGNLDASAAAGGSAVLVLQGVEQLIAKVRPDPLTGIARLSASVPAGGPYFVTAIVPGGAGPAFIVSATVPVNVRVLDPASHPADGQPQNPLSGGFHGWHFGDFNGNLALEREPLRFPGLNPVEGAAPYFFATPAGLVDDALGVDAIGWEVRGGGFIGRDVWRPSRVGGPLALAAEALSALRLGETWNADFSADVLAVEAGFNFGASTSELDLFDLNGDRLPDSVTLDGVRFNGGPSLGFGPREPVPMGIGAQHELRETKHFNARIGLDLGGLFGSDGGQFRNETDTRGDNVQLISTSFRAGQDYGVSATNIDFADINGDGLVDQVHRDGAQNFSVRLGLGYRFSEPFEWLGSRWPDFNLTAGRVLTDVIDEVVDLAENNTPDVVKVRDTGTSSVGVGGSVGIPGLITFQAGGGLSFTQSRTLVDLVDLTGDGLPEAVMKLPDDGFLRVQLNFGSEFGPVERWPLPAWPAGALAGEGFDALGSGDALDFDRNRSSSINVGVSACFLIVCGGVSGNRSTGQGGATLELTDLDGDGLVDHVLKESGDDVYAKLNQLGKANLLVRVERPLGGSFDLDYRREGNQAAPEAGVDMPRSQHALAATRINDGRGESYVQVHDYRGGRIDRDERDNYGYASVLTTRLPDGSQVESEFHNQDFFRKGMLARQVEREVSADGPFDLVAQEVAYAAPAASGATEPRTSLFFPKELERRSTRFEKPDPAAQHALLDGGGKTRREAREFDAYGDLSSLAESGELDDPSDDLTYTLEHQRAELPYLSLPRSIVARGPDPGAAPLRERRATYDDRGAIESATDRIHGGKDARGRVYAGTPATTSYAVDDLGNLFSVVDPVGYTLELAYDDALATFVASSVDSFYLESRELIDYRFGVSRAVTDVNGHTTLFDYDDYGRMTRVRDARAEAARKNTIELLYSQRPGAPSPLPAWAKTLHRDELRTSAGQERDPIVTVTFADGLGRVIQTKKDLEKDFRDGRSSVVGMAVSGQVRFDPRGRVQLQGQPTFETLSAPSHLPDSSATTFSAAAPLRPVRTDHDVLGRVLAVTLADGTRTETAYSAGELDGQLWFTTRVRDAESNERIAYRDVDDSIMGVLEHNTFDGAPRTLITRYVYNPIDELIQVRDAAGNLTRATYDSLGRMVELDSPDLGLTTSAFDLSGHLIEKQTAELRYQGKAIRYEYDLDRLLEVRYPDTEPVRLEYGNFDQAGDAYGNLAGRLSLESSEAGQRRFEYDALGNVVYEGMRFNDAERYEHREYTEDSGDAPPPRDPRDRDDPDDGAELALQYEYDSFARLLHVDFPTGCRERLLYEYDAGGSVRAAYGLDQSRDRRCPREPNRTDYVTHIGYDEFEQRTRIVYGNGVETRFDFEPETRRLASLDSQHFVPSRDRRPRESNGGAWVAFQSLRYDYDDVGNITGLDNLAPFDGHDPEDARVGTTSQRFSYDPLYQLTAAQGTYRDSLSGENRYQLDIAYDPIGNIERKRQLSERWKSGGTPGEGGASLELDYVLDDQSYLYHYLYEGYQPHAPSAIAEHDPTEEREDGRDRPQPDDRQKKQFLEYDESGNQLYRERRYDFREIDWSSENQIRSVTQDAETISKSLYDGSNTRRAHFQRTTNGAEQTSYLGQYVTVRDGEYVTLHVFAGDMRIASKREPSDGGESVSPLWFHPDHLGSTQYVSDEEQRLVTHAEYFPSGELWIDERSSDSRDAPVFLFNGKELEESTGLLAYGARHYDARQGQWLSADPILDRYMGGEPNGGVYSPGNLGLHSHATNNPLNRVDRGGQYAELTASGNQIHIVIPMVFIGKGAETHAARVVAAIQQRFSGRFGEYVVETVVNTDPRGKANVLELTDVVSLVDGRYGEASLDRGFQTYGDLQEGEDGYRLYADHGFAFVQNGYYEVVLHEVGHFLGLKDRYDYATRRDDKGYEGHLMSTASPNKIGLLFASDFAQIRRTYGSTPQDAWATTLESAPLREPQIPLPTRRPER
jgi:RHS repeat-associated protein